MARKAAAAVSKNSEDKRPMRRWTTDEKIDIVKKIQAMPTIVDGLKKYEIFPTQYYAWLKLSSGSVAPRPRGRRPKALTSAVTLSDTIAPTPVTLGKRGRPASTKTPSVFVELTKDLIDLQADFQKNLTKVLTKFHKAYDKYVTE